MTKLRIAGCLTRLRVFAAIKSTMEADNRCPTSAEVADKIGMSKWSVDKHFLALIGAADLPMPIPDGACRRLDAVVLRDRVKYADPVELDGVLEHGA